MKVRAKERGFDNVELREVGDEFVLQGPLYPWMEVVGEAPKAHEQSVPDQGQEAHDEPAGDEKSSIVDQVMSKVFGGEPAHEEPKVQDEPALAEPPRKKRAKKH